MTFLLSQEIADFSFLKSRNLPRSRRMSSATIPLALTPFSPIQLSFPLGFQVHSSSSGAFHPTSRVSSLAAFQSGLRSFWTHQGHRQAWRNDNCCGQRSTQFYIFFAFGYLATAIFSASLICIMNFCKQGLVPFSSFSIFKKLVSILLDGWVLLLYTLVLTI